MAESVQPSPDDMGSGLRRMADWLVQRGERVRAGVLRDWADEWVLLAAEVSELRDEVRVLEQRQEYLDTVIEGIRTRLTPKLD